MFSSELDTYEIQREIERYSWQYVLFLKIHTAEAFNVDFIPFALPCLALLVVEHLIAVSVSSGIAATRPPPARQ